MGKEEIANSKDQLADFNPLGRRFIGQPVFVVLDPPLDAGNAENKIVIKPGQTLNLTGVLKLMPNPQQAQQQWGLSSKEAQALKNQALYLLAVQVQFQ